MSKAVSSPKPPKPRGTEEPQGVDRVAAARAAVLDGVGREIAASFPGITRLGGQIVAALYLADRPLSMDELSEELGRSKSNIFANLRGLEGAGIVERHRASGTRHDTFALRGKYPDVVVGAYLTRLRRVVLDKVNLCNRALGLLGDAEGTEADALREKLTSLLKKYERFAVVFAEIIPVAEGPVDLEDLIDNIPSAMMGVFSSMARRALGLTPRALNGDKKSAARKS
ncbi:MAG TPA: MarR family transcriptional regulator [Labilithrix sp.]|nr:MarR family transcriptional regulator [Labilithrix sp.]